MLDDLLVGARLGLALPRFLRHALTPAQARAALGERLARRSDVFLETIRHTVYGQPDSPYARLLTWAGCEIGDLERLVRQDGIEGALRTLVRNGVYLTVEEFKGRRPVVRGSTTLAVDPSRLRNPLSTAHVLGSTSGSRGPGIPVASDLAFIRDRAVNTAVVLDARGGRQWRHAVWAVPGGDSLVPLLRLSAAGARPTAWFTLVSPRASGLHWRYRASGWLIAAVSPLSGRRLPGPIDASLEQPQPILDWVAGVRRGGGTPHLYTFVSPAVRLCRAAAAQGLDLAGVQFTVTGEPLTATRLAAIQRAGAEARPTYASTEAGSIGEGCLARATPDDVHVLHDRVAVVQAGAAGGVPGLPSRALLVTALRPHGPYVLLNASLGDEADLEDRPGCCALADLGWPSHLRSIQSFEKLTAGGMTLLDVDVVRVLEESLPARFGGGPTDYQLVEEEAADGQPRLRLLVHPDLGPLAPGEVQAAFLEAIGQGSGAERVFALAWRTGDVLRVERQAPLATRSGKILHVRATSS